VGLYLEGLMPNEHERWVCTLRG